MMSMVDEAVEATEDLPPVLDVNEFRQSGLLHEINRLILHPLGLAMYVDSAYTRIGVFDMRYDPEGVYYHDDTIRPEAATYVAEKLEARGQARIDQLGYVIQPLPPEVKQLKVSILEPTSVYLGGPDELDEGEELELTQVPEPIATAHYVDADGVEHSTPVYESEADLDRAEQIESD